MTSRPRTRCVGSILMLWIVLSPVDLSAQLPQGARRLQEVAPSTTLTGSSAVPTLPVLELQREPLLAAPFVDDMESGPGAWTAQAPWALTTISSHSPGHSWTDSPGTAYANNLNLSLVTPVLDLSTLTRANLSFWHRIDLESGFDFAKVWASADEGQTFTLLASFTGSNSNWGEETLVLDAVAGEPAVRIYFQLLTDFSVTRDGWYLDDVRIWEPDVDGQVLLAVGDGYWDSSSNLFEIRNYRENPTAVNIGETGVVLFDVAVDPVTEQIFAVSGDGDLYRLSPSNGLAAYVGSTGLDGLNALEFDANGVAFGWSAYDSVLYKIGTSDASLTAVGDTGFTSGGDLAFDASGALYGSTGSSLVRIDPESGAGTLVGSHGISAVYGLDFDLDGVLFAGTGSGSSGTIYTLSRETGAGAALGTVGGAALGLNGLSFVRSPSRGGVLEFPLPGAGPYSASITAVFDHSMTTDGNCPDDIVIAYTGEEGRAAWGKSTWYTNPVGCGDLYGFAPPPAESFIVNGNYATPALLYYDGHTGFDYPATNGTCVFAAADGVVISPVGGPNDEVTIEHADGLSTHYLHLSAIESAVVPGYVVEAGTKIGEVGAGHLHFTVKRNGVRVDPYGWDDESRPDPYSETFPEVKNLLLWSGPEVLFEGSFECGLQGWSVVP